MKGYKVVLEDKNNHFFYSLAVIANNTQEAIDLARLELGDKENKYVLYDMELITSGVIMKESYYS